MVTYSTPACLVGAGQGVSCLFFFFFVEALVSAEAPPWDNPETLDAAIGPFRPEASNSFFLASSCASSSFLLFRSCSNLQISGRYLMPLVHKIMHPIRHPFPFLFSILCLLGQADTLLMQSLDFSHHLLHLCSKGSGHAFKNWSTQDSRKKGIGQAPGRGIGTRIGSLLNLARNFSFLSLSLLLLLGAFVLEIPIEFHCDSKHISTFYGG